MPPMWPERRTLALARGAIDRVDDSLIVLLAMRRRLVATIARCKRRTGSAPRDLMRERQIRLRIDRLAARLNVPSSTAQQLLDLVIREACRQQGIDITDASGRTSVDLGHGSDTPAAANMRGAFPDDMAATDMKLRLLRLIPPPRRFAPLLRVVPQAWQRHGIERAVARVLGASVQDGSLEFMRGRRLGIEVSDLGLRWVFQLGADGLRLVDGPAEAGVRGSATDLLLLASRLEDADTLFFQRRLALTGDVELGLTARNLLERLPWEQVPLGERIVLNRGARFARVARAVYHGEVA
ncbi:ubiquinone anaerobic biosynthesis accessory factor UbiT [Dyella silvae]|uniref:ubiquinone anaerobic biosynthesis accessory factor UbiT n=1 Tax=Dyella silvae TaxID=2994424 RepID=UPI00226462C5|nr:chorismate mutase [Dyella silvae]